MLKIWGRKNSSNVRKVLWCAEEAGVAYQRLDAGGAFGVVDKPEFLARNPNGLVPVLEDGDLVLWESNSIVRYLAAAYATGALYQVDPASRAFADKWMDWTTSTFAGAFRELFWGTLRTPVERRDLAAIEVARQHCIALLALSEQALGEHDYLSGDAFGMGDIPLGCFIYAWFEMPIERPSQPNLQAWYARLRERPAYQRAVMTELT
ncbi:glutathione S-transferase family protein [Phytopseudomonas daroniae]|uniref:glutathione S-transferase family protein n=1 Tax=Phytopseudomonas daroniae TaxID=2487519 RepID=UPI0010383B17|nr:glutathione S-transferase [Pseudomonas daroniae]TBU72938.1 glutathione S-transferase [Pseudomonas daroniae]